MFLYKKKNAISIDLCNRFINAFESSAEKHPGILYGNNGDTSLSYKKSTDITFSPEYLNNPIWNPLLSQVVDIIIKNQNNYIDIHSLAMSKVDSFQMSTLFNMQRYNPGEGFNEWHCERASNKFGHRILVWMIYLNTITDKGETEFYYQHHSEPAEAGKLIIWPSDWTYLHRGVVSPSQTKYILTGWFNMLNKN
jgi:hypothetical protein